MDTPSLCWLGLQDPATLTLPMALMSGFPRCLLSNTIQSWMLSELHCAVQSSAANNFHQDHGIPAIRFSRPPIRTSTSHCHCSEMDCTNLSEWRETTIRAAGMCSALSCAAQSCPGMCSALSFAAQSCPTQDTNILLGRPPPLHCAAKSCATQDLAPCAALEGWRLGLYIMGLFSASARLLCFPCMGHEEDTGTLPWIPLRCATQQLTASPYDSKGSAER